MKAPCRIIKLVGCDRAPVGLRVVKDVGLDLLGLVRLQFLKEQVDVFGRFLLSANFHFHVLMILLLVTKIEGFYSINELRILLVFLPASELTPKFA